MIADLSENFIVIVAPSQCPSLLRQSEAIYLAKITDVRLELRAVIYDLSITA